MRRYVFFVGMLVASFSGGQQVLKSPLTIGSSNKAWNAFTDVEAIQVGLVWREKQATTKGNVSKEIDSMLKLKRIVKLNFGEKVNYLGTFSLRTNGPHWTLEKVTSKARIPTDALVYKVQVLDGKLKGKTFFVERGILSGTQPAKD
jgi:hypothetical protein